MSGFFHMIVEYPVYWELKTLIWTGQLKCMVKTLLKKNDQKTHRDLKELSLINLILRPLSCNSDLLCWTTTCTCLVVYFIPCDAAILAHGNRPADGKCQTSFPSHLQQRQDLPSFCIVWKVSCTGNAPIPLSWIWMFCLKKNELPSILHQTVGKFSIQPKIN